MKSLWVYISSRMKRWTSADRHTAANALFCPNDAGHTPYLNRPRSISFAIPRDPLSRGIAKLIDLGLLRYGVWPASFGQKRAFAAVWRSAEVQRFIRDEIYTQSDFMRDY